MWVLEALGCAGPTFNAFSHTDLRAVLAERLGGPAADVTPARLAYSLRQLRGKGLLRKVPRRNLYTLTDVGYQSVVYLTKLHERLRAPALDSLDVALRERLDGSPHRLDRALVDLNARFDHLAHIVGLKTAA